MSICVNRTSFTLCVLDKSYLSRPFTRLVKYIKSSPNVISCENMPEHPCPKCDYIASTPSDLRKHLKRKNACDEGDYGCDDCGKRFQSRTGLWEHNQNQRCHGRVISRAQLEQKVDELTSQLKAIEENTARAIVPYQPGSEDSVDDDEDDAEVVDANPSTEIFIIRPDIKIKTIGFTDVKRPQLYFYEAGPALIPLVPNRGILFKFGESQVIYKRLTTHRRDHKGGRLVDSIPSVNPKAVEIEFKRWMNLTGRLIEAKTSNKKTVDGEIFVVENQDEYATIVNKAMELAKEHQQEVDSQSDLVGQLNSMREELVALRGSFSTIV